MNYPLRHISIRVPWHDTGWDGRVCSAPRLNGACLKLKGIAQKRNDAAEEAVAGQSIKDLPQEQWPSCVAERAGFMAPFEYTRMANHPYNRGEETLHGHFTETPLRHPPYTAAAVPFAWMLQEAMKDLGEQYALDVQAEREPDLGFKTQWVQELQNQKALLDCFRGHIKAQESLCFFYAKQVPFVEDATAGRILIGVGRVLHVAPAQEYAYKTKDLNGKLRSALWELMVQHSIRPDFKDGFLLPYHAAIHKAANDPSFDPSEIAAFAPDDRMIEFSHASQLVTHDGAIAALLACAESLRETKASLPGPWERCLEWIDARVGELWKARGPCPGLAAALSAFGLDSGTFIARILADKAGENADPWPLVTSMFADPAKHLPAELARGVGETLRAKWAKLPDERRALLRLVSRFEITAEQAKLLYVQEIRSKVGVETTDADIIGNPYLLFEATHATTNPISVWTVDRGVFPPGIIRSAHPLPAPSALDAGTDARRVRALSVSVLEDAAADGNTLLPQEQLVLKIRDLTLDPPCEVDADLMNVAKDRFGGAIGELTMANGAPALQLERLSEMGSVIRTALDKRIAGKRLTVDADWRKLLDTHLEKRGSKNVDEQEGSARAEKVEALKALSESRLSVLIGPAGTGKTTLLSVFCSQPEIEAGRGLAACAHGQGACSHGAVHQGP